MDLKLLAEKNPAEKNGAEKNGAEKNPAEKNPAEVNEFQNILSCLEDHVKKQFDRYLENVSIDNDNEVNEVANKFAPFHRLSRDLEKIRNDMQSLQDRVNPNRYYYIEIIDIYFRRIHLCYYAKKFNKGLNILIKIEKLFKAINSTYYQRLIGNIFKAYLYLLSGMCEQAKETWKEIRKLVPSGRDTENEEIMMKSVANLKVIFDIIGR